MIVYYIFEDSTVSFGGYSSAEVVKRLILMEPLKRLTII